MVRKFCRIHGRGVSGERRCCLFGYCSSETVRGCAAADRTVSPGCREPEDAECKQGSKDTVYSRPTPVVAWTTLNSQLARFSEDWERLSDH